ncbi:hypothetical protein [Pseudoalteromonas luteoviolacea]|uniref:hypothetical protein n=1 Tax=Pseudoalteromonas luteoviolacea TaxID=43657 RepID=UPI001B39C669|nr:hypothetical protein [Pseudoalteromonas luteoviolacea]MBQ4840040.1 hypothetical protein [Pseudoalteromonas luteoviolacea]
MKSFILKVWNDAVGSKIISTAILTVISALSLYISNFELSKLYGWFFIQVSFPVWSIIIVLLIIVVFSTIFLRIIVERTQSDLTDCDIEIQLSNWWPEKGMYDGNVVVNFEKVDKELRLPKGSTKRLIASVAKEKYYLPHNLGDKNAEFKVDFSRIVGG